MENNCPFCDGEAEILNVDGEVKGYCHNCDLLLHIEEMDIEEDD